MIAGHPRSGTTMLVQLCNTHPRVRVTNEYRCFQGLGRGLREYAKTLHRPRQYDLVPGASRAPKRPGLRNMDLHLRFLARLIPHAREVRLEHVRTALSSLWPEAAVVGDKVPRYLRLMRDFRDTPGLRRVVIYRDCRDIVQSSLARANRDWAHVSWIAGGDVEAVSRHWMAAMRRLEAVRDSAYVIRYEEFVADPVAGVAGLANYLGVDARGFDPTVIRLSSAGKWRTALTRDQAAAVERTAGETMAAWGYR